MSKKIKPAIGFLKKLYAVYALTVFVVTFLALFPFMFVFVHLPQARQVVHTLYRIWGIVVFTFTGIYAFPKWKFKMRKGQAYVFCANHSSYADIPTLYISIWRDIAFIGKASLKKAPLFGYIYSKMHILVDRKSSDSRKEVVEKAKAAIDKGISPVIFPEGTIPKVGKRPQMIEFKDGAFKIAIEKQVPIVPVSILNNYKILPDDNMWNVTILPSKAVFHPPVNTKGLTLNDLPLLKAKVYALIASELTVNES